jgi:7-cyano-7-deazaguanine reductase
MNDQSLRTLGSKVTGFDGFDTFPTPKGVTKVKAISDEVTAVCPVTGQPDWYIVTIEYSPREKCVESKTLKLYLQSFRNKGLFCEAFSSKIAHDILQELNAAWVKVTVIQKARGGVSLEATTELDGTTE